MNKERPTMPNPKSPVKNNKRTTASEEINVITQVTAEAERLKEQNSKLREEMENMRRQLEELKAVNENRPGKSEEESEDESEARKPRERSNHTRGERLNAREESANMLGNVRLPRGGWLMDPFAEVKYKGREDGQNPIKFLKKFEKIAEYENIDPRDQLHYFKKCMRGNASNWVEVDDPEDIEEAKDSFREYFWGEEQQARFREGLYTGKYKAEKGETMAEYAMNLARQAKYLEPPMNDHEIIRCVKRHFGSEIAREIRPSTAKTIGELTILLDEMEYEKKLVKQSRRQYTEDNQTSARKVYEVRPKTAIVRDSAPRRLNEQYSGYGPERRYGNYATGGQRKRWSEDDRERRQSSVQITELANSEEEEDNKKVVKYNKDVARNRQREDRVAPKAQLAKKHVAVVKVKRDRNRDERKSSEEEESEAGSQDEDRDSESAIASIRTEELLEEVDEVSYEDQTKVKIQKGPFVTATFNKMSVKCLIDTGAQVSAMSKEVYEQLKQDGVKMEIKPVEKMQLVGAFSKKTIKILFKTILEFRIEKARFEQEILVVDKLVHDIVFGIDFICDHNAAIQCGDDGIEVELESEDRKVVTINAIMIEQDAPDITNCTAEEMDTFFGILNITEEEVDEGEEPLFTQKEIEEIFLSDEAEIGETRGAKNRNLEEKSEPSKATLLERIAGEEQGKNIAILNIYGPFFGAKSEQKYALTMTDIRSESKRTYYMPDKRLKTLTDTITNKYLRTERKPNVIITDRQGQFRNAKWRIFCAKMGIKARTLDPTTNPTANPGKSSTGKARCETNLREEEKNIIAENRKIIEMKKQLETIQMRIPKEAEMTTSPVQQNGMLGGKETRRNSKHSSDEDSEEEIQSRRGSDDRRNSKEPENKRKAHKESRVRQKEEKDKEIHILQDPEPSEKKTKASEDPTKTPEYLKNKESRRGRIIEEQKNKRILTDMQHRRGSDPAKSMKRTIGSISEAETEDTPRKEPVKKRRINQEAFELMLRAKDILSERIPAKKILARIQKSKCKVYLDKEGQCDVITTTCKERLVEEKVEMEEIDKEELKPECIRKIEDMRVRMMKMEIVIDDKEMEINPIVLFGRNDAMILGKESERKLTLLQERRSEHTYPMERSEGHLQLPEATASDQKGEDEPKTSMRRPGTFKYVTMSKYYGDLQIENLESDTQNNTDTDNTEDDKNKEEKVETSKNKKDRDNRKDKQISRTCEVNKIDKIERSDRLTVDDRLENDIQQAIDENRKRIEERDEQYETDETIKINNSSKRGNRRTSMITHVSREEDETDTNTNDTLSSNDYEEQKQLSETSLIIAGQINRTNETVNIQPARSDDRSLNTKNIDGDTIDQVCSEIGPEQMYSQTILSETRRGNIDTNASVRYSVKKRNRARDRMRMIRKKKLGLLVEAAYRLLQRLTEFMRDAYTEESEISDALRDSLSRISRTQKGTAHMRRRKKEATADEQDTVPGEGRTDSDDTSGARKIDKENESRRKPKVIQHLVGTFVNQAEKGVRTRTPENRSEKGRQKTLNLEDEQSFEGSQGEIERSPRRIERDKIRSPAKEYPKRKSINLQSEEGSPVKKRRRPTKILISGDEDADKENGLNSNRISHNPLLEKVHPKYKLNFGQTLEGGMRSIDKGSVGKGREGAKQQAGDGTRGHPRQSCSTMEKQKDARSIFEHRRSNAWGNSDSDRHS